MYFVNNIIRGGVKVLRGGAENFRRGAVIPPPPKSGLVFVYYHFLEDLVSLIEEYTLVHSLARAWSDLRTKNVNMSNANTYI